MSAAPPGMRPPQQARSRAALERLLASAEYVLINAGVDEFTIARVAEHAGVSVGGVYRRFESREQLIQAVRQEVMARLVSSVTDALDSAPDTLEGVIEAFVGALGRALATSGRVIPAIIEGGRSAGSPEQGLPSVRALQERFFAAAHGYAGQIRHADPEVALMVAFRGVLANGAYRTVSMDIWPDGLDWAQWSHEIADLTTAYLTAPR